MLMQDLWSKVPEKWQYEMKSFGHTVAASLIVELSIQVGTHQELLDPTMLSKQLLFSVALACARSAWKAGLTYLITQWKK
jgi:hypothetical protein